MGNRPGHGPNGTVSLTARQRQILRLVAEGLTNRDIAEELRISIRTAEVHRFNLMRRLKVGNVAQLLHESLRQGLLPKNVFKPVKREF
jgi:DNA-binding NarL/FixJ family response regulator